MEGFQAADGRNLLKMLEGAADWLECNAEDLDALNVFPVPDGDTGTNMLLTVRAALASAAALEVAAAGDGRRGAPARLPAQPPAQLPTASAVAVAMARGAMEGARGNSGVILSQFFRGLAFVLEGKETCSPEDFASAFSHAESFARKGISNPAEGTILTVLADVSRALARGSSSDTTRFADALGTAVRAARESVETTPFLLPVLKESGVVDAGAKGMLRVLEGFLRTVQEAPGMPAGGPRTSADRAPGPSRPVPARHAGSYGFCTEFLLEGDSLALPAIRKRLEQEGTSLILVGDSSAARVHLHTARPEAVIEYARSLGTVSRLEVEDLDKQCEAIITPRTGTAVLAVVQGDGLAAVCRSLGAVVIVPDAPAGSPSPREIRRALEREPSAQIILLPNSVQAIAAAEEAGTPPGKTVLIVPSRTVPQGIAALLSFRFEAGLQANAALMTRAFESVRSIDVALEGREAGSIRAEGYLDGALAVVLDDPVRAMERLLSQVDTESVEVVTIYAGAAADASLIARAEAAVRRSVPRATVAAVPGGQARPLLILSLE